MKKDIATPSRTKEILQENNIRPVKRLGQNFLIDKNIINKIIQACAVSSNDNIIEIGPGIGSLTQAILDQLVSGKLLAIEKDSKLADFLKGEFGDKNNLSIINQDVLKINWNDFLRDYSLTGEKTKVMANLPYYITTPVIMGLLESGIKFNRLCFMVQKEVAERMVAPPGGKDYGSLSIAVQFYARPEIIYEVPATVFIPKPRVESAIIILDPFNTPPVEVSNQEFFFKLVKALFQQRRKTIKNSLSKSAVFNLDKGLVLNSLNKAGIDPVLRGEKLSIAEMAELSNIIYYYLNENFS